jgi:hypothetical protein
MRGTGPQLLQAKILCIVPEMRLALLLVLMLSACGAAVGVSDDDQVDAAPEIDAPDVDAAPACFNGRVVYLNFEGQALTRATVSDARNNLASWMNIAAGTAPRFRTADADRNAKIQAIVDGVTAQLSSFPITVVTTRPASGEFVMIVYGGQAQQVGSDFGLAVQELDCNDAATRNDVAWVADVNDTQIAVNVSLGAIGFGLGLTATTVTTDCMCGWDNNCQPDDTVQCTLTPGIARDPTANQVCAGQTAQDEVAVFAAGFCQ